MSRELQLRLKVGDQIVATEVAYYSHPGAEGKQSQSVGDILMVNNPGLGAFEKTGDPSHISDLVSGCGLNRKARRPGERPSLGLCTSLRVGTFRLATPDDNGYIGTREQWMGYADKQLRRTRLESFVWAAIALMSLAYTAWSNLP